MILPIEHFGVTADVAITILVDNRTDLLVESTETVRRFTETPLLAEHGFAALVDLKEKGIRILWDAGGSHVALPENLRRMKIDPATIQQVALSHGHYDHTTAVSDVLRAMNLIPTAREWPHDTPSARLSEWGKAPGVPIIAHPAAFRERWSVRQDGTRVGPGMPPPREEWAALGGRIILSAEPYPLAPGCWTTGFIPRTSFETAGVSPSLRYREGDNLVPDQLEDDQAIVINVKDKGLIVLSGCAHAGIVNTLTHARTISGVDRVHAVIGGFHLARAKTTEIQQSIDLVRQNQPTLVAPSHCSGFEAIAQLAAQLPEAFTQSLVGTTFLF